MKLDEESTKKKKRSIKKMLKHKTFRMRNIFSLFSFITVVMLIIFIVILDILPTNYNVLIGTFLIIIDLLGIIFINVHKKIILKIFGWLLLIILASGSIFGIYYLDSTNKFINKSFVSTNTYTKNTYYVLAKKSKKFKETSIEGTIGVYKETVNINKALEKLKETHEINSQEYEDIGALFSSLNADANNFILVEKSSYEIVFQLDKELSKNDYEIVYEFDLFTKRKASNSVNYDNFNIFIGGTDFAGLMDFNMIASVNMKNHQVVLTSIPRDYYIEVAGKNGAYDKLSFMNTYGPTTNKESLEKLFGIDIDYTLTVNTTSLVTVVDYIGGIEFCSDTTFTTTHAMVNNTYNDRGTKLTIRKGCQRLDGIAALTLARERNAFAGRDRVRQENCQKIILAIFKELVSTNTILHYNETLNTLGSLYETDLPKEVITNIAKDILNNGNKWDIKTQAVDGTDGHAKVHLSNMTDWVMFPNQETVESASASINGLMNN